MAGPGEPASRLYAIADAECLGTEPSRFAECVVALASAGVRLVQLRLKPMEPSLAADDLLRVEMIERTLSALDESGLRDQMQLWLDDRVDLAAVFPGAFAGVHVGHSDLPPGRVREILRDDDVLIGLSCHDLEQVEVAEADADVDWVAIGPVYATGSKPNPDPVVGLDGLRRVREATSKPLVAIGGIDKGRIDSVLEAGADAAVVLSALASGGRRPAEIEHAARRLIGRAESTRIDEHKSEETR